MVVRALSMQVSRQQLAPAVRPMDLYSEALGCSLLAAVGLPNVEFSRAAR